MSVTTNIFSALGNNSSSLWPIIIKDSVVENAGRVYMSHRQGSKVSPEMGKHEARERAIEEYTTSAVWLGGIPLLKGIFDRTIFKAAKLSPEVDYALLSKNSAAQGIDVNVTKFTNKPGAEEAVEQLRRIAVKKPLFKALSIAKFAVATALPVAFLGLILPKLNYGFTKEKLVKETSSEDKKDTNDNALNAYVRFKSNKLSFKGGITDFIANPVSNMQLLDYGLSAGRVANGRTNGEKVEFAAKEAAMIYFIYKGGQHLQKLLEKGARKLLNIPIKLDNKIIEAKEFAQRVTQQTKVTLVDASEKGIIGLIDDKPDDFIVRMARKTGIVKTLKGSNLRDPRKFVDTEAVKKLADNMNDFIDTANKSGNVPGFLKKAKWVKRGAIVLNLALCSFATAIALPKAQFMLREALTGNPASPGIRKLKKDVTG